MSFISFRDFLKTRNDFTTTITEAKVGDGWYGYKHLKGVQMSPEYKEFFKILSAQFSDDSDIYITPEDSLKSSKQLVIKVTNRDLLKSIAEAPSLVPYNITMKGDSAKTDPKSGVNVTFNLSGGVRGTGKLQRYGESVKNPTTAQQEMGTIVWFEHMLKHNKAPSIETLKAATKFDFNQEWLYNFEAQYSAFEKFIASHGSIQGIKNSKIYLDSGKNESNIITTLAKKFGLKDSKDNWNPADIWVMNITAAQIEKETNDFKSLAEFNEYLKVKFNSLEIIGVSLKKISLGKPGNPKVVDNQKLPDVHLKPSRIVYNQGNSNFIFETQGTPAGFNIRMGTKAGSVKREEDIKFYAEGRMTGTSVQLGAVSAQLMDSIYKEYGFDRDADKKKIFSDPESSLEYYHSRVVKIPYVVNTTNGSDIKTDDLGMKVSAFLAYNIWVFSHFSEETLKTIFFSASKLSDISSIHLKIY